MELELVKDSTNPFIESKITIPISVRLTHFIKVRNLTPEKLEKLSLETEGKSICARSIYNYLNGKTQNIKEKNIERLAELMGIKSEHLRRDIGKFFRGTEEFDELLKNSSDVYTYLDKDGNSYLLPKDYEKDLDEYLLDQEEDWIVDSADIDDSSNIKILENILFKFASLHLSDCYKLAIYFDGYIKINRNTYQFVLRYHSLNKDGKEKLKNLVNQLGTTIELQLYNSNIFTNYLPSFFKVRDLIKKDTYKSLNIEKDTPEGKKIYFSLLKEFSEKVNNVKDINDIERFYNLIDYILLFGPDDWDMIIAFTLLADNLGLFLTEKQEAITLFAEKLLKESRYSKDWKYFQNLF